MPPSSIKMRKFRTTGTKILLLYLWMILNKYRMSQIKRKRLRKARLSNPRPSSCSTRTSRMKWKARWRKKNPTEILSWSQLIIPNKKNPSKLPKPNLLFLIYTTSATLDKLQDPIKVQLNSWLPKDSTKEPVAISIPLPLPSNRPPIKKNF